MIKLQHYTNNSKEHSEEQIKLLSNMIKRFGWRQPILVNSLDNTIIAGHGRYLAYEKYPKKLKTPWVINDLGQTISGEAETTPLSIEEEKAYRHLDNIVSEMAKTNITTYKSDIEEITDPEIVEMFNTEIEVIKGYDEPEEIELGKLEENKASFNFTYPHGEYLNLLDLMQKGIMQTGTETKEGLLAYLLEQFK